ncbi:UvrD-like helicase C-terminal domain-containing protein [Cnuella takakiae]|uniref:UvrD-like helicase C-terminal domain-containing protein n=1 Tax=Cnuella takakiae TaxID=1302690 RepID=A0A1M4TBB9_9BACT|nr:AAA family ATPase [Cnuella takakiae]OLY90703.1 hypothetical protein BUE76_01410 [Cnuella takakiae]SHE41644.1 UvrD-like helicase C-terminal domain-containing protein [Cnuella takakiae]
MASATTTNDILSFLHFHTPTKEQKDALIAMEQFVQEDNTDDFLILSGAAGTGKSSISSALIGYLNDRKVKYSIVAPTGRAARILGRKAKTVSSTIHSLIYSPESDKETAVVKWTPKPNRSVAFTIFIVDEASMIPALPPKQKDSLFQSDDSLLNHLAAFVKDGNKKNKIIFLGDKNQLPPIGESTSLALDSTYLIRKFNWSGNLYNLTEVKRVEDGSYIIKTATRIREAIDKGGALQQVNEGTRHKNTWDAARDYAKNYDAGNPDAAITIGHYHGSNKFFNDEVRKILYGANAPYLQKGDLLMVTSNWRRGEHMLYNGDHVVVEAVDTSRVENVAGIHFLPICIRAKSISGEEQLIEDYMMVDILLSKKPELMSEAENKLRGERFKKNKIFSESGNIEDDRYVGALCLAYGYAITCHKAQGGEWEKVYVNTFGVKDNKWLYTAVTRTREDLNIF